MKFIFVLTICIFLSACVTSEQIAQADYGPPPTDVETQAKSYFETALKDSETARYKFGTLDKGWTKDLLVAGGKAHFGWIQIVSVNSKNSYGAYTGFQEYYLLFERGTLVGDVTDLVLAAQGGFSKKG
jgi:hypothetical protein